ELVGPRAELASRGSRAYRGGLLRDIRGGVLATVPASVGFLRQARMQYDRIIVIGDLTMVLGCRLAALSGITYIDVYRSGYERSYWGIEKRLIRMTCARVFCRSAALAKSLRDAGIDASAAGNVMMDTIPRGDYDAKAQRIRPLAVVLLPGSRDTTIDNFRIQAAALRLLPEALRPDLFLALSAGVDPVALGQIASLRFAPAATAEAGDAGTLTGDLTVHLSRDVLGNLLDASDLALSQAGTATIQTIGSGKPVVTMRAKRNRDARIKGISALYGEARILVEAEPDSVASALRQLLADPAERARRSAIGRERIGPPGAIAAIIAELSR
ncbi:MAG: hypothetical protein ABIO40_11180, partial [Devosia sp.]